MFDFENEEEQETSGKELALVFVKQAGEHNDALIYEFYFSDRPEDAIGKRWEDVCQYQVSPPEEEFCTKIGVLKTSEIVLSLLEESDCFRYLEGVNKIVALAWEYIEDFNELPSLEYEMLSFFYGAPMSEVIDKLESKGLVLQFD